MVVTPSLNRLDPKIKVLHRLFFFHLQLFHIVQITHKWWMVGLILYLALDELVRAEFHYLGEEITGFFDVDSSEAISHLQKIDKFLSWRNNLVFILVNADHFVNRQVALFLEITIDWIVIQFLAMIGKLSIF